MVSVIEESDLDICPSQRTSTIFFMDLEECSRGEDDTCQALKRAKWATHRGKTAIEKKNMCGYGTLLSRGYILLVATRG